jgi:hypothetical protein
MKSVFRPAPLTPPEVTALTAFLSDRAAGGRSSTEGRRFFASGLFAAAVLLGLIGFAWRGRLRPVRRGIVSGGQR